MTGVVVSRACLICLACVLSWTVIARPYQNAPPIRSDGVGYHIWVYALQNRDLNFCQYKKILDPTLSISVTNEQTGVCGLKYPPGIALLHYPFVAAFLAADPNTGFSAIEHTVVLVIGSILLLLWCYFSYQSLAMLGCPVLPRLLSIAAFALGSGLFHYSTYDASLSHIYSAFGAAALIWLLVKYRDRQWSGPALAGLSLLICWLYLVRPTNLIITTVLICHYLLGAKSQRKRMIGSVWFIATLLAALLGIAYNYHVSGHVGISSYGQEHFIRFASHALDVLVSWSKGVVLYQPIFLLTAILALFQWRQAFARVYLSLFMMLTLLYGSWHAWDLGGGFGHRGFVELASVGVVTLALAWPQLTPFRRKTLAVMLMLCSYVTLALMISYWRGWYPFSGSSRADYLVSLVHQVGDKQKKLAYEPDTFAAVKLTLLSQISGAAGAYVRVLLTNESHETLYASPSMYYPVRLSWRFIDSQGNPASGFNTRLDLPEDLRPGGELAVQIPIEPATEIPEGTLAVTLVQEGVFWGQDVGLEPLYIGWE